MQFWFSLSHLIFTCSRDSSEVMYKTFFFRDIFPAAWRMMVLFPIPGSPPSKTTEPGTIPPPSTLSNSWKPLENLDIFSDVISSNNFAFLVWGLFFFGVLNFWVLFSSTIVFHSLQFRHLPKYWDVSDRQFWQTKVENLFLIN